MERSVPFWVVRDRVTHKCSYNGGPVRPGLADYLVAAVTGQDNQEGASFSAGDVEEIVESCQQRIQDNGLEMAAADLQLFLETEFTSREQFLDVMRKEEEAVHNMALEDIMTTLVASSWDLDQLHQKVVLYVVQKSGLGSHKDPAVLQDCAAALSSVWPDGTLEKFIFLTPKQKRAELQDYLLLSSGVRLFNKENHRGGIGIPDLSQMLKDNLAFCKEQIVSKLESATKDRDTLIEYVLNYGEPESPDEDRTRENLNDALLFLCEYVKAITTCKREIGESEAISNRAKVIYRQRVKQLENDCRNERVVAADVVFPLFVGLAQNWTILQGEDKRVNFLRKIIEDASRRLEAWRTFQDSLADFTEQQNTFSVPTVIKPEDLRGLSVRLLQKDSVAGYNEIPLSLKGNCIATLVDYDGLLTAGDRNIGIVQFDEQFFCFRNSEAALRFAKDPNRYFEGLCRLLKKKPILCRLVQSDDKLLSQSRTQRNAKKVGGMAVLKVDSAAQTVLHPVSHHYDPNYDWNVWNIRKKAYDMYRITQCVTHSSQTVLSSNRNECSLQTVMSPRNRDVQTKQESSSSAVRHVQYLAGLRGGPDAFNKTRFGQLDLSSDQHRGLAYSTTCDTDMQTDAPDQEKKQSRSSLPSVDELSVDSPPVESAVAEGHA